MKTVLLIITLGLFGCQGSTPISNTSESSSFESDTSDYFPEAGEKLPTCPTYYHTVVVGGQSYKVADPEACGVWDSSTDTEQDLQNNTQDDWTLDNPFVDLNQEPKILVPSRVLK